MAKAMRCNRCGFRANSCSINETSELPNRFMKLFRCCMKFRAGPLSNTLTGGELAGMTIGS